ncbi:DUF2752 domain-containing protein [Verrucomicrobiaceae bacterium 227]
MAFDRDSSWPRWIVLAPLILIALSSVHLVKGILPGCLFHEVTGWHCPGCGATRATEALVGFRWIEAVRQNAFWSLAIIVGLPFLILSASREKFPKVRWLQPFRWRLGFLWVILATLVVFGIVRNLPAMDWLAPY